MTWAVRVRARNQAFELEIDVEGGAGATAILGPNGAGKTTTLRVLAGLQRPRSGRVCIGDQVVCDVHTRRWVPPERRGVGYLPQGYGLFPHLSALRNVAFGLRGSDRLDRARQALADLDAAHLVDRRPRALSGGEQQRVALARALVTSPRLLLLDEPLAALDVGLRRATRAFLAERVREAGLPTVLVTHDVRDVRALADEAIVLSAGRVVQRGTPDALAADPADAFTAELFEASPA